MMAQANRRRRAAFLAQSTKCEFVTGLRQSHLALFLSRIVSKALQIICGVLVVIVVGVLPASSATRNVLLLFDERLDMPGLATIDADLVRTLTSNSTDTIEVYREAMDLSQFGSNSYQPLLRDFLRAKYAGKRMDVAVAVVRPALEFLLSYGEAIFPGTPIVFCGIDRTEISGRSLPRHVRGVLLKREFAPTLELALTLHPQTNHVAVVAGTSEFDVRVLEQAKREFHLYEDRLAFTYLSALPMQELLLALSKLPPRTIVLFTTLFRDGAGASFVPHDVVSRVSAAATAPTYGFLDQFVGRGIVGETFTAPHYTGQRQGNWCCRYYRALTLQSRPWWRRRPTRCCSIGAKCSDGASASAVCRLGATSSFVS